MIKIMVEITDGKGYHKVLFIICDAKMRERAIEAAERFLQCGLNKIGRIKMQPTTPVGDR